MKSDRKKGAFKREIDEKGVELRRRPTPTEIDLNEITDQVCMDMLDGKEMLTEFDWRYPTDAILKRMDGSHGARDPMLSLDFDVGNANGQGQGDKWECTKCTFKMNAVGDPICEICQTEREPK